MILQSLCGYYDRLAEDPDSGIPLNGYANVGISSCIVINQDGDVISVKSLCKQVDKRILPTYFIVPEPPKRSGQRPAPAFLCEKAEFIFGIYKEEKGAGYRFEASRMLHEEVLGCIDDEGAVALLKFFAKRTQGRYDVYEIDVSPLDDGGNIIFQLQGDSQFMHERPAIRRAWESYRAQMSESVEKGLCLITGEYAPIARLHGNVRGFGKDKPTLVGFNQPAFESYGKKQGMNAPVSETATFKYVTALNSLMDDPMHHIKLHGDRIVFWAERSAPIEEALAACFFSPDYAVEDIGLDEGTSAKVRGILSALYNGRMPDNTEFDNSVRFYVLGVSANMTRLVVRFFYTDTFCGIAGRIAQHYKDITIVGSKRTPSPYRILLETAVGRESGNVAPNLEGALIQSILNGTSYPASLYQALLGRIRAEGGKDPKKAKGFAINSLRTGMIKGYLNRMDRINNKKEGITVALNKEEKDIAYVLGRLFALLEKAQKDALGDVNASIVDKYLNSALATPQMVFPMLLTLSKKHIKKADNWYIDRLIGEVAAMLPSTGFPISLNAEQQGRFIIGYYHQNQAIYTKKSDGANGVSSDDNIETEE